MVCKPTLLPLNTSNTSDMQQIAKKRVCLFTIQVHMYQKNNLIRISTHLSARLDVNNGNERRKQGMIHAAPAD